MGVVNGRSSELADQGADTREVTGATVLTKRTIVLLLDMVSLSAAGAASVSESSGR